MSDSEKALAKRRFRNLRSSWSELRYDEMHNKPYLIGKKNEEDEEKVIHVMSSDKSLDFKDLKSIIKDSEQSSVLLNICGSDSSSVIYKCEMGLEPNQLSDEESMEAMNLNNEARQASPELIEVDSEDDENKERDKREQNLENEDDENKERDKREQNLENEEDGNEESDEIEDSSENEEDGNEESDEIEDSSENEESEENVEVIDIEDESQERVEVIVVEDDSQERVEVILVEDDSQESVMNVVNELNKENVGELNNVDNKLCEKLDSEIGDN